MMSLLLAFSIIFLSPFTLPQPYHLSLEADSPDELTSDYIMTKIQETRSVISNILIDGSHVPGIYSEGGEHMDFLPPRG